MQTSTELATTNNQRKSEIETLLAEANQHQQQCQACVRDVGTAQQNALWHAWQIGIRLNAIKEKIGHGDWMDWLNLNFCEPNKITTRTAQNYMKIDADNTNLRDAANPKTKRFSQTTIDLQLLSKLKHDTVRKHAFAFVPEKKRPKLRGNKKFARLMHHITVVNEFNRWKRRREIGLIEKNVVQERRDFRPIFDWLKAELFNCEG